MCLVSFLFLFYFLCLVLQVTYENAISKSPDEETDLFFKKRIIKYKML